MSPLALDVVTKTGKTPVLGRMLSKYVGRKTSSIENDITKARNHLRQRGKIMERKYMAIPYPMMPSDLIDYSRTWGLFTNQRLYSRRLASILVVFRPSLRIIVTLIYGSIP